MLNLNIRNMPDGLVKRLKIQAAILGQPLREYVIDALVTSVNADEGEWMRLSATHDQPACPTASQQAQQQAVAGQQKPNDQPSGFGVEPPRKPPFR